MAEPSGTAQGARVVAWAEALAPLGIEYHQDGDDGAWYLGEDEYQTPADAVRAAIAQMQGEAKLAWHAHAEAMAELERLSPVPALTPPAQGGAHAHHGRGTSEDGPDDPDCPCQGTTAEAECARAGCGFCMVTVRTVLAAQAGEPRGARRLAEAVPVAPFYNQKCAACGEPWRLHPAFAPLPAACKAALDASAAAERAEGSANG